MKAKISGRPMSERRLSSVAEVEAYLAKVPKPQRLALGNLRKVIRSVVPEAEEGFSYGMPAFRYLGRPLVAYGAFKGHCSFFPMSPAVQASFSKELKGYTTSKGTIQFLPEAPLSATLVKRIVKARMKEIKDRNG